VATHPEHDSEHDVTGDESLDAAPGLDAAPDLGVPEGPDVLPALEAVRREVVLDAAPDDVWRQFEEADALSGWLADEVDVEVRPGAEGTVRDADGPHRAVTVEEVVPGRRLGLRWRDVGDRPTVVEIGLEPLGNDRTRVVVVEVPVAVLSLVAPAADRVLAVAGGGAARGGTSASAGGGAPTARGGARALAGVR
jgi:uncharacterized protein YndB with AHSA1/START domain